MSANLREIANASVPLASDLPRSPAYIAQSVKGLGPIVLMGACEIPFLSLPFSSLKDTRSNPVFCKLAGSLNLGNFAPVITPAEFTELLLEQYSAAAEYVFGHPLWAQIRDGNVAALNAYVLETRHYLAGAASRMSPSIRPGIGLSPLSLLLSKHLLEEWDHAVFFESALARMGCAPGLVSTVRPLPATLEWVHVTRFIGSKGALNAAVCSGFMEHTATQQDAVRDWHSMLSRKGYLSSSACDAIAAHFETDIGFEHAQNWKKAVALHGAVVPTQAADLLNDVSLLAEMIYRWQTALLQGNAARLVEGIQLLSEDEPQADIAHAQHYDAAIFNGLPVWPAGLNACMNGEQAGQTQACATVNALAYGLGHHCEKDDLPAHKGHPLWHLAKQQAAQLGAPVACDLGDAATLAQAAKSWLIAIDGHALWSAMTLPNSAHLVAGYMLENYHYLASATHHVCAAIASCTNTSVRLLLIAHLGDELQHCDAFKDKLQREFGIDSIDRMRPLPTTLAFVGYLERLATQDWKAYILVSAFLQFSLSECRQERRHFRFYEQVSAQNPQAASLLRAMSMHDQVDDDLGHDHMPELRLQQMLKDGPLPQDAYQQAAIAPLLAWSFFDGIREHYSHGEVALAQRLGWHAC